ncbi:MAG: hypothetical protein ABMB14_10880 [Myxococcota bacterium]
MGLAELILAGCAGAEPSVPPAAAPCDGAWDSVGRPILLTWCTPCHGSTVPPDARQGAPVGVDFDTWAGTAAYADRIAARATGDGATMPPGGGMPDADRQALAAWLGCGMLGGTVPEVDPCAAPTAVTGPPDCAATTGAAVDGDLAADGELPCLGAAGGALTVTADASLPRLTDVGGTLVSDGATRLDADQLAHVGGLTLGGPLAAASLPALARVDGAVRVTAPGLDVVPLGAIRSVGGDLVVEDVGAATSLDLARVQDIGGSLIVRRAPALVTVGGTLGLVSIGGDLVLTELPALRSLDGFGELVVLGGDVRLTGIGAEAMTGFDRLTEIPGDLWIEDLDRLPIASAFPDLVAIHGSFGIVGNAALTDWIGLPWLSAVDGDLAIVDNPSLPTAVAEALAARITVGGTVTIDGNQP